MIRQMTVAPETASLSTMETHSQTLDATIPAALNANEQLRQRVRLFLTGSNLPGLRHIDVEVHGDTVILNGSVRTFYEKQLAVRLSRRVAGVIHVVDSIEAWGYLPHAESRATALRSAEQNSARPR
jgi:CO dehydrogenase/acetyl-CoA synthase epsilon subunit